MRRQLLLFYCLIVLYVNYLTQSFGYDSLWTECSETYSLYFLNVYAWYALYLMHAQWSNAFTKRVQ